MHYNVLACDYDGTLAYKDGVVGLRTRESLERWRDQGHQLLLITGRILDDMQRVFPRLDLFSAVIAENGAHLFFPASSSEQLLAEPAPPALLQALRKRGISPFLGRVIVATWHPHEATVLEILEERKLDWQIILNKGAVMILPTGIDKATGLAAALRELQLAPTQVVGVGDAENDLSFLSLCGCSVAVKSALPALRSQADYLLTDEEEGMAELIEALLADDLGKLKR
jgi:hydroxymethylpyrimidine pyrophosphatase-like HAD family hydrolase